MKLIFEILLRHETYIVLLSVEITFYRLIHDQSQSRIQSVHKKLNIFLSRNIKTSRCHPGNTRGGFQVDNTQTLGASAVDHTCSRCSHADRSSCKIQTRRRRPNAYACLTTRSRDEQNVRRAAALSTGHDLFPTRPVPPVDRTSSRENSSRAQTRPRTNNGTADATGRSDKLTFVFIVIFCTFCHAHT